MPRKNDKRKGRRQTRSIATISSGATRRSAASGASAATSLPSTGARITQNSRGNRSAAPGRKAIKRAPPPRKQINKRGRGKKEKQQLQNLNSYRADTGEIYKPGDFAYVDSQQPELPYHICVIRDFKLARKDSVVAEVKWYYRVSELPEAVYSLLMEDRKSCKDPEVFDHPLVRQRELFMAFNIDTHPASLFRGKCEVKELENIPSVAEYLMKDNCFFFCYGYKPESRRLTDLSEESLVPLSQQAQLPECSANAEVNSAQPKSGSASPPPPFDRYNQSDERMNMEELVWKPSMPDDQLLMYLRAARSIALHAGVCMSGHISDGYLAASSDETTQHAFDVLHRNDHDVDKALQELVKRPIVSRLVSKKKWNKESTVLFAKGMRQFGKNFTKIREELLPDRGVQELAEYYYYWKKTSAGLSSRGTRRQRKQLHIRMCRSVLKTREVTPERVFADLQSCDEDEGEGEEDEKPKTSYYACRHCYTTASPSWHHAGTQRNILCQTCRLHFQQYGHMRPVKDKGSPPDFMFKDFHTNTAAQEEELAMLPSFPPPTSGRKTRNSNGTRGVGSRPGLRSGKKNDVEEEDEAEVSDSSESSSEEEPVSLHKSKLLPSRRSILNHMDEGGRQGEEPPSKRPKREEDNEGNESEEEGSGNSMNDDRDMDGTQKSTEDVKSPGHSSSSSQVDDEGGSPCSSRDSSETPASTAPQQFKRVSKDHEDTCARTDLVYIHPPPEEKKMATDTNKVIPLPGPSSVSHPGMDHPPLSTPTLTPGQKVTITPHDPQLPLGPSPFITFPVPFPPMTPLSAGTPGVGHENLFVRPVDPAAVVALREHEQQQLALWQQQQQQQWLQALHQQQKQLHELHELQSQFTPHIPPPHTNTPPHPSNTAPHPVPAHLSFVPGVSNAHPQHSHSRPHSHSVEASSSQPVAFNFPTPEEVHIMKHRLAQMGQPPEAIAMGVLPPGIPLDHSHIAKLEEQHHHQQQAALAAAMGVHLVPGMPHVSLELLMQQQQQQQAALAVAQAASGMSPGVIAPTPENIHEFQRQFEAVMLQVQKDPQLLHLPQVQQMIQQQRLLAMHVQGVPLQEQNYQQRMQEMLIQQQHEMQKHFAGVVRPTHEETHGRGVGRPPVIVQPK